MLKKVISIAENLGKSLAKKDLSKIDFLSISKKNTDQPTTISKNIEENKEIESSESSKASTSYDYKNTKNFAYYLISPFRDNDKGIAYWQGFLSNFSNLKQKISFYVIGNGKEISFCAKVPYALATYFENTFYSNFSTSDLQQKNTPEFIAKIEEYSNKINYINFADSAELNIDKDFSKDGSYLDPFKDLLSNYNSIPFESELGLVFEYTFKLKENKFIKAFKTLLEFVVGVFAKNKEQSAQPQEKPNIFFKIGYKIKINDEIFKSRFGKDLASSFEKFLKKGKIKVKNNVKYFPCTYVQVSNFFHLLKKEDYVKSLNYLTYRKLPYPSKVPTIDNSIKNDITLLGYTDFKTDNVKFGIRNEDKFRHVYIIGKTGTGKSTLISNMVRSDMITNKGVAVVDPHGDLVETLIEHVPSWRTNDVVLFDVADYEYPIGFNILQHENENEKINIVSGVVSIFKKLYGHSWGPRLEYVLRNALLALVDYPGATLMHLTRMLTDKMFRQEIYSYITDVHVLKFWKSEFDVLGDTQRNETIGPIVNKVGQFLSSPIVRNIFGQQKSTINIRKAMDEGKILLINLSKGKIGEDNAEMIGSFLVTKFQIDAMARADMPMDKRNPFYLYIDEFQNFATESFESILSEARKYKLSLIVANQYISQIEENIRNAIFGNVGTIISFGLGVDDAKIMSEQYKGIVSPNDLLSIPKFKAYAKLMVDGMVYDPFNMVTFPLPTPELSEEVKDKIRKQSRQRYGMERGRLEALMKVWAEKSFSPVEKVMEKARQEAEAMQKASQAIKSGKPIDSPKSSSQSAGVVEPKEKLKTIDAKPAQIKTIKTVNKIQQNNEVIKEIKLPEVESIKKDLKSNEKQVEISKDEIIQVKKEEKEQIIQSTDALPESLQGIVLGQRYDGLVKLKFNYGLFVIVNGSVEGLLHKNFIDCPDGVRWKDLYEIGDRIKVKADSFKEVNGEKRVVWVQ